ncbi:MAG: glycosyltransferase [Candidatus Staskawiczbacteria bacterium]|nr:glycosyltransferase [Candidatus Staskawiczbacteria bacterium]
MEKEIYLSVIIPIYNEENILISATENILSFLRNQAFSFEMILAENGSRDKTLEVAKNLQETYPLEVRVVSAGEPNYGLALKKGIVEARGKYIISDEIDIGNFDFYKQSLSILEKESVEMVIGSKQLAGADDGRPWSRKVASRIINLLLWVFLGFKGTETHGLKAWKKDKLDNIVKQCVTDKDIFASELVIRAEKQGIKIKEIPFKIEETRSARINLLKRVPNVIKNIIKLRQALKNKKRDWHKIFLVVVIVFFLLLVFYGFPDSPAPWFDEGINLGIAKSLVKEGVYNFSIGPRQFVEQKYLMMTTGYPLLFPLALVFKIFGVGLGQAKLVMFVFLGLFVFLFYKLASRLSGKYFALGSLALLVTFLPLYGNGKSVLGEIPGLTYFLGGLWLLDKNKRWQIFLAGLLISLGAVTKPVYLLLLVSVAIGEIWLALHNKKIDWARWFWLGLGVILPLITWIFNLLPNGLSATSLVSLFNYYRNPYQVAVESMMFKNLFRFFSESTPLHFAILLTVVTIGQIIKRKFQYWEVVLTSFIWLIFLFYLRTAGWYRYFFPAHVLLFVLFPSALYLVISKLTMLSWRQKLVGALIAILCIFQTVNLFAQIRQRLYYDPIPRQFASAVEKIVSPQQSVMVIDNPAAAFFLDSMIIYQSVTINPYLKVGQLVLQGDKQDPKFLIVSNFDNVDKSTVASIKLNYKVILEMGRSVLYERN